MGTWSDNRVVAREHQMVTGTVVEVRMTNCEGEMQEVDRSCFGYTGQKRNRKRCPQAAEDNMGQKRWKETNSLGLRKRQKCYLTLPLKKHSGKNKTKKNLVGSGIFMESKKFSIWLTQTTTRVTNPNYLCFFPILLKFLHDWILWNVATNQTLKTGFHATINAPAN